MPDYIYLLENRLSADQQNALRQMREAAREAGMILFLTGDAVRDLTSGHAVRGLEVAVHGNALTLKETIEKLGATVWGEDETSRSLYLCFPGTVRVDVISTHRAEYPNPGQPVNHAAPILEDLRRRDFTVNAMAISLNEGSFGLLMDPLNGAADIESQTLRLVSNYGFLEEPSLLIRATRYHARLGWEMDTRTRTRYENAKGEDVMQYLSAQARSQELEQIGHENDGLKVLQALEAEGWMKVLFPAWTSAKADEERLKALHELALELLQQGVHADMSAAQMELLTAKLAPKELTALKKMMLRPGFVEEWNSLDAMAAGFAKTLLAKENATPSVSYKLFTSYDPEAILWLGFTSKDAAVRERFNLFLKVWPEARQRIPHALMQEMRITPELAIYNEIVQNLFLELIDGKLAAAEEMRAFLEPHSPPAPPQKETIKRPRAKRGAEAKLKEQAFDEDEESDEESDEDEDLDDLGVDFGTDEVEVDLHLSISKEALEEDIEEDEEEEAEAKPAKRLAKTPPPAASPVKEGKVSPVSAPPHAPAKAKVEKPINVASAPASSIRSSHTVAKPGAAKAPPQAAKSAAKVPVKTAVKIPVKAAAKVAATPTAKAAPVKGKPVPAASSKTPPKPASKGASSKPAKKH
jgi:tRNA nucleotidyltransferase/poly(A) polymerase